MRGYHIIFNLKTGKNMIIRQNKSGNMKIKPVFWLYREFYK